MTTRVPKRVRVQSIDPVSQFRGMLLGEFAASISNRGRHLLESASEDTLRKLADTAIEHGVPPESVDRMLRQISASYPGSDTVLGEVEDRPLGPRVVDLADDLDDFFVDVAEVEQQQLREDAAELEQDAVQRGQQFSFQQKVLSGQIVPDPASPGQFIDLTTGEVADVSNIDSRVLLASQSLATGDFEAAQEVIQGLPAELVGGFASLEAAAGNMIGLPGNLAEHGTYKDGDEIEKGLALSPRTRAWLQGRFVEGGLLPESYPTSGDWDEASQAALRTTMGRVNRSLAYAATSGNPSQFNNYFQTLDAYEREHAAGVEAATQFERLPFRRPNRAETERTISDNFESQLRRKPTRAELEDLSDVWDERVRLSFEKSEDTRFFRDLAEKARASGEELVPGALEPLDTPESPQSAFNRIFEEKYGGTIERNEDRDRARTRGLSFLGRDLP